MDYGGMDESGEEEDDWESEGGGEGTDDSEGEEGAWAHLGHGRETPSGRPTCAETWPRQMRSAGTTCKGKPSN